MAATVEWCGKCEKYSEVAARTYQGDKILRCQCVVKADTPAPVDPIHHAVMRPRPHPGGMSSGPELRDAALEHMENRESTRLGDVRAAMAQLWRTRGKPVTADDVRDYCERHAIPTGPWMGAVFKDDRWVAVDGPVLSRHPANHGRWIRQWERVSISRPPARGGR